MEALEGREDTASTHSRPRHYLGVSVQRHATAALYPQVKNPRYLLDKRLGGPRAGRDTEARGKILSPLPAIESRLPNRAVRSQTLY
jgi:hypothetical protein